MGQMSCLRCRFASLATARFCSQCGLNLEDALGRGAVPGSIRHPHPLEKSDGYLPIEKSANLHFRTESNFGGRSLLSTEGRTITIFNAGYGLTDVSVRVQGFGESQRPLFRVDMDLADLPMGEELSLELPSYEIPAPVERISVELLSASFGDWKCER